MTELLKTPAFYLMISFFAFEIGLIINRKTKVAMLNPLLIGIIIVIMLLKLLNIDYADYSRGTQVISFLLAPATVVLAVPLYKNIEHLKQHAFPILAGITIGSAVGIVSVIMLSYALRLSASLTLSLVPKSVTTPIGIEVSKGLGGIPSITIASIILTGIIGAIIAPYVLKVFRIRDKVAAGTAIGTASHAVGTAKAIEIGELEGAMSSLSIGVAGLITVFLAPVIVKLLERFI